MTDMTILSQHYSDPSDWSDSISASLAAWGLNHTDLQCYKSHTIWLYIHMDSWFNSSPWNWQHSDFPFRETIRPGCVSL